MKMITFSLMLAASISLFNSTAWAAPNRISFVHKPILPALLPEPGRSTTLEINLPNNRDLSVKVRAEVVIDGVLLDIPMEGNFGDNDRTVYRTVIKAPLNDVVYRFHIQDGQNESTSSEQFRIERICAFDQTPTDISGIEELTSLEQARKYSAASKALEVENVSYNEVLTTIKKIEEMLQ
jgi:hypothetical protein